MSTEKFLCISYFDNIIGPNIFYCNKELTKDPSSPNLGRILEFAEEESSFILSYNNFQALNHIFLIDNPQARGGKDLFMISYLIRGDLIMDQISDVYYYLHSKKPILLDFAEKLKELEELPKVVMKNKYESLTADVQRLGSKDFQEKFHKIFNKTYNNLAMKEEQNVEPGQENVKKLFILGANQVGKTTFLNQVRAIQSNLKKTSDLKTKIFEVILENVEELQDECYEELLKCEQCEINNRCITLAQGFIIIFDKSRKDSIKQAKERYNRIVDKFCKYQPNKPIPILLIGNIFQGNEGDADGIPSNGWKREKTKQCKIITKQVSIDLENKGDTLKDSFRWIIKQMI